MKFPTGLVILVLLALAGVGAFLYLRDMKGTFATSGFAVGYCQANNDIPTADRAAVDAAALRFLDLLSRSPAEARAQMSSGGRASMTDDAMQTAAESYNAVLKAEAPRVTETFVMRFTNGTEDGPHVPCGFEEGRAAFVSRGGTPESAVVVLTRDLPAGSGRSVSVWLDREENQWRVRGAYWNFDRILGKGTEELWADARRERAAGKVFNASMFYAAARSTLEQGTFYQPRLFNDFNADFQTFAAPTILRGQAPYRWEFSGETFSVLKVEYSGYESGELALLIDHRPPAAWTDNAEAEAINQRLMAGFDASYPEWRDVFDAVVVRANKPGSNQRWGTVLRRPGSVAPAQSDPPPTAPAPPG